MSKNEQVLRENIRRIIQYVKQKRQNDENEIRESLKKLMRLELKQMLSEAGTPDTDPTPNKSTGINVLEELLKKIVPVLQTDYKSLTTSEDQRQSFRAHIVNAVINTLTPAKVNNQAGQENVEPLDEVIDIDISDDDKFIDIRTDAEKKAEEEENAPDEREQFGTGVDGDETGRNMAYESFKKVQSSIIDAYELLSNPEDQELFYDYLIANLKLYFDKFEAELAGTVEEPTNQAYDTAKEEPAGGGMGDEPAPDEGDEEELELDLGL
tara:strand:- start:59 stop:859 length:801 start_codon:yes stop_codon:yes gene_type:complete